MNFLMKIHIPPNNDIKLAFFKENSDFPEEIEILLPSWIILQFKSTKTKK